MRPLLATICLIATMTLADVGVIAHRGWHDATNENTLASLKKAQEAGLWGSEFDVRMTLDEKLVVHHDPAINGTNICNQTYSAIAKHVTPVNDFLKQSISYPNTVLVIDLKVDGDMNRNFRMADLLIESLEKHDLLHTNRVMFISFNGSICKHIAKKLPGFMVQSESPRDPQLVKWERMNGIDFQYKKYYEHPEWVDKAHKLGMLVNAWVVNDTNNVKRLVSMGVDLITTDCPDHVSAACHP